MEQLTVPSPAAPAASAGEGDKRTRPTASQMKTRCYAATHCLVWCIALLSTLRTNGHGTHSTWHWVAMHVQPTVNLIAFGYTVHHAPAWSTPQRMDRMALLMLTPPLNNWIVNAIVPTFNVVNVQWSMVLIANVLVGVVVADLPPAHSLIHTLFISAGFGALEFMKACGQLGTDAGGSGLTSAATAAVAAAATAGGMLHDAAATASGALHDTTAAAGAAGEAAAAAGAAAAAAARSFEALGEASLHHPAGDDAVGLMGDASCGSLGMVLRFLLHRWLPMLALALCTSAVASISVLSSRFSLHNRDEVPTADAAAQPTDAASKPQTPGNSRAPFPHPTSSPTAATAATAATAPASSGRADSLSGSGGHLSPPDLDSGFSVPFQTMGTHAFACLRGYHRALAGLASAMRQDTLLSFACLPLVLYDLAWLVICRGNVSPAYSMQNRSAESIVISMIASFILGRDSSKLDISGLLRHVSTRLAATQAVLTDVLPAHIVSATLRRLMAPAPSPGKALSPKAAHMHGSFSRSSQEREGQLPPLQGGRAEVQDQGQGHGHGGAASSIGYRSAAAAAAAAAASTGAPVSAALPVLVTDSNPPTPGSNPPAPNSNQPALPPALTAEQRATLSRRRPVRRCASAIGPDLLPVAEAHGRLGWQTAYARDHGSLTLGQRSSQPSGTFRSRLSVREFYIGHQREGLGLSIRQSYLGNHMVNEAMGAFVDQSLPLPHTSPHISHPTSTRSSGGSLDGSAVDLTSLDHTHAASHESCTLFFSDIVGFSSWAGRLPPAKVMHTLDTLYTRFDDLIINEFPSLYKVETIGDAYVVAANLLAPDPDHAATMVHFALRVQEEVAKVQRPDKHDRTPLQMRIGLHSGSLMSGIVGKIRRRWCLFGDCMNMAARTESTCPPGCVQLTSATHELAAPALKRGVTLRQRGEVQVKGREQPIMMWLAEAQTDASA